MSAVLNLVNVTELLAERMDPNVHEAARKVLEEVKSRIEEAKKAHPDMEEESFDEFFRRKQERRDAELKAYLDSIFIKEGKIEKNPTTLNSAFVKEEKKDAKS